MTDQPPQIPPTSPSRLTPAARIVTLRGDLDPVEPADRYGMRRLGRRLRTRALALRERLPPGDELWVHVAVIAAALLVVVAAAVSPLQKAAERQGPKAAGRPPAVQKARYAPASGDSANPVFRLQDLSPGEAQIYNSLVPIANQPNPAARPFNLSAASPQDQARALECLTAAIYYEAATEPLDGQRAVAQVVLNRLRDPGYPKTVCGVVFDGSERATGWQFSFTGDGSLARTPSEAGWARARAVAEAALGGFVMRAVGHATHYHTVWVAPYWSPQVLKVANIGAHVFYRWAGGRGLPGAFSGTYAGGEPAIPELVRPGDAAEPVPPPEPEIRIADSGADPEPAPPAPVPIEAPSTPIAVAAVAPPSTEGLAPPAPAVRRAPAWSRLPVSSAW